MNKGSYGPFLSAGLAILLVSLACGALVPAATTSPAADVPAATVAVPTLGSTTTAEAAPTEDPAAAQQTAKRDSQLSTYLDKGYIQTVQGKYIDVTDFKKESAQINHYDTWTFDGTYSNFVFGGHFKWSTASGTPDLSGCGVVFGRQDSGDQYTVFLDRSRIAFTLSRGGHTYEVGKTRGSGRVSYGNPAEADFALIVDGQKAHVAADGGFTDYTLSADQTSAGQMGLAVLSGTNKDYGTRCEITQAFIWEPNP